MDKSNTDKPTTEIITLGRPRKDIDEKILGNLASLGCTIEEIAGVLSVSARTLRRNYAEIIDANRERGKASLRKKLWDKAMKENNTHMLIWLSKNYLGMKDRTVNENINEPLPLVIETKTVNVTDGKKEK